MLRACCFFRFCVLRFCSGVGCLWSALVSRFPVSASASLGLLPLFLWLLCFVVSLPLLLPFWLLRSLFFVRFRRPRFRGSCRGRWACVPVSAVPALCSRAFCFRFFPAVAWRFSGEVVFVWVLVSGVSPTPAPSTAKGVSLCVS